MHKPSSLDSRRVAAFRSAAVRAVCMLAVALGSAVCFVFLVQPYLRSPSSAAEHSMAPLSNATSFVSLGIGEPPTVPASQAGLNEEEEVIGVSVAGQARAYLVSAFDGPRAHVVNDLLSGRPISVTHCDRTARTRVFTGPPEQEPLVIACAGWHEEGLLLSAPGGIYAQENVRPLMEGFHAFPYPEFPFTETSWGKWRRAHPDTDVYLGGQPEPADWEKAPGTSSLGSVPMVKVQAKRPAQSRKNPGKK